MVMQENIWYENFTWSEPSSQEILCFILIMSSQGPELSRNKIHNFL